MPLTPLPPLDKVEPTEAWQPWQPGPHDPWNLKWAGHLYRRAGFGAPLVELHEAVRRGFPATVERILCGDPEADARNHFLETLGAQVADQGEDAPLRGWWLYCMLHSLHPLREKLTLFWHNHFATSDAKVQRPLLMYQQNRVLRKHALGRFGPLLLDISRDPAMLVWLDSNSNIKAHPNENYAREVMELFSLGVGHYTEKDIREAARAFTGWHTDEDRFDFNASLHDNGPKTVLGQRGTWNGDDVVRIVLAQPAAAPFLARKMYRYLVSESAEPPARLLEPLADGFRRSDYDIGQLVGTILRSRHFFSAHAYRQRVKSPAEFVVGTARTLTDHPIRPAALDPWLEQMGQQLFAPPNVKGWEGGRSWLNTATVLARHNFAQQAAGEYFHPAARGAEAEKQSPEQQVAGLADLLLDGELNASARARLVAFLSEGKPKGPALERRLREAAHTVMALSEYQLA